MKKQGYLLLVLLMSAFVFCSCGQKDTKEAQDQTEETAKDTKEDDRRFPAHADPGTGLKVAAANIAYRFATIDKHRA